MNEHVFTLHNTAPGNYGAMSFGLHFSQGMVFADAGFGECIEVPAAALSGFASTIAWEDEA